MKKNVIFWVVLILINTVIISFLIFGFIGIYFKNVYYRLKTPSKGWEGALTEYDAKLGFKYIANAKAFQTCGSKSKIPTYTDENGFRIPISNMKNQSNEESLLTLGCSHTHGAALYAKDTFPFLVGDMTGLKVFNGGVCSYGLSQMLIRARQLIPKIKPKYLIVQYSPWLIERSISGFAPIHYGRSPVPYFYKSNDSIKIAPPLFKAQRLNLTSQKQKFSKTKISKLDYFLFILKFGIPLAVDEIKYCYYKIASKLGFVPEFGNDDNLDKKMIVKEVYKEISNLAKKYKVTMIILILRNGHHANMQDLEMFPKNVTIVDAHTAMLNKLGDHINKESYSKAYWHWKGVPPRIVDRHPNSKAHKIIAYEIVKKIKELENYSD
ncbi:hypothetical protein ACFL1F_01205 [Chlamydiota bacterium]